MEVLGALTRLQLCGNFVTSCMIYVYTYVYIYMYVAVIIIIIIIIIRTQSLKHMGVVHTRKIEL